MINWVIGAVVIGLMALALRKTIKNAKAGGCGCGCSGCSSADKCESSR